MEGEKIQSKTAEFQGKSKETMAKTEGRAKGMLENRKDQAAERLSHVAEAVRRSGRNMEGEDEKVARYTTMAADRIEDLAGYLRRRDVESFMDQAERFARKRPEVFLGGAFALGFLMSRFIKSSGREAQYEPHEGVHGRAYPGRTVPGWQEETAAYDQPEKRRSTETAPGVGPT